MRPDYEDCRCCSLEAPRETNIGSKPKSTDGREGPFKVRKSLPNVSNRRDVERKTHGNVVGVCEGFRKKYVLLIMDTVGNSNQRG